MTNARILIVEDDALSAREMADILSGAGFDVSLAETLPAGLAAAAASTFEAIVLDRMLPGGDGINALQGLRASQPGVMILMVSALGRAANRIEGLDKGADDYLAKPFEPEELTARIRALLRRAEPVAEDGLMQFGALQIRTKARTVHAGEVHVPLSPREFDLLVFFARNHGDLVTRMQLLEHVWNLHFDPQTNVVDVHVSRLRRKLEAAMEAPLLHTERGFGYVFDPSRPADVAEG